MNIIVFNVLFNSSVAVFYNYYSCIRFKVNFQILRFQGFSDYLDNFQIAFYNSFVTVGTLFQYKRLYEILGFPMLFITVLFFIPSRSVQQRQYIYIFCCLIIYFVCVYVHIFKSIISIIILFLNTI